MSLGLIIAPRIKQEMTRTILYLVGLHSKILDTVAAMKLRQSIINDFSP